MVKSQCIEKIGCPDCGSSDSLQTYLNTDEGLGIDWYTSFCHGMCWEQKGDPYAGKQAPTVHIKTEQELKEELTTISRCKDFEPRKQYRGISPPAFGGYGLKVLLSEFDGKSPYALAFPFTSEGKGIVGWKCRPLTSKNFFSFGNTRDTDLFGFELSLSRATSNLWITEGEFDTIALDESIFAVVGKRPPVASLTHGGGSVVRNLEKVCDRLIREGIETLHLCLDEDDVGAKAYEDAKQVWSKVKYVPKPDGCKDANDAVKKGLAVQMGNMALGRII